MRRTTSQPHHTAQVHHLRELIGTTVTVQLITRELPGTLQPVPDPRHARVIVRDVSTPYGAARLLITPEHGTGEAWISADKLTDWPGRTNDGDFTPEQLDRARAAHEEEPTT
jgi:hypothetical protein